MHLSSQKDRAVADVCDGVRYRWRTEAVLEQLGAENRENKKMTQMT
jgi:hypothetical protein